MRFNPEYKAFGKLGKSIMVVRRTARAYRNRIVDKSHRTWGEFRARLEFGTHEEGKSERTFRTFT